MLERETANGLPETDPGDAPADDDATANDLERCLGGGHRR
jgi:hypothetical protein